MASSMVVDDRKKFSCSCGHEFEFRKQLVSHVHSSHARDRVNWICNICKATFPIPRPLRDHYRHVHKLLGQDQGVTVQVQAIEHLHVFEGEGSDNVVMADGEEQQQIDGDPEVVADGHEIEHENVNIQQRIRSAVLEMSSILTGRLRVTETALNFIFASLASIEKIREEGRDRGELAVPPYDEFRTSYKRRKIMVKEAGVVLPVEVEIGSAVAKDRRSGRFRRVPIFGYFVPVIKTLKLLLQHTEILNAVRSSQNGAAANGCTATASNIWEIYLGLSIDDVEFSNPIGQAKGTHKQTIATYHLLNLPPEWRIRDEAKNLLFICKASVFNRSMVADRALLQDLRAAVTDSENGIPLLEGSSQLFRVRFKRITADAEALCSLLKMKKTGSKTKRPCWACNITGDRMRLDFDVDSLVLRTVQSHEEDCRRIRAVHLTDNERMQEEIDTGVRGRSALLDIPGFGFDLVCFDSMHCLLEGGILELAFKDFVRKLVSSGVITLQDLNGLISEWEFKLQPGDVRPPELPNRILTGGGLGYKARCLVLLAENILFIVRMKRNEARADFQHFARCLRLSQALLEAPSWSEHNLIMLKVRIVHFLLCRMSFYDWATVTSKMHFILHLVKQIIKHGATKNTCCMSDERHYKVVKSKISSCFKNLSFSLAMYHQHWQIPALFELKDGLMKPKSFKLVMTPAGEMKEENIPADINQMFHAEIMTARIYQYMKYGSMKFAVGDIFDLGNLESWNPEFAEVQCFLTDGVSITAIVQYLISNQFEPDFGCFVVKRGGYGVIDFLQLKNKFVMPHFVVDETMYVNRKYSAALEYD